MTVVAFGSAKGSPGVTTLALLVAASLPRDAVRLVEADPDGGDLAARFAMGVDPGLVSAAAALRHGAPTSAGDLALHTQPLPGGLPVVLAPSSREQTCAALATGVHLADAVAHDPGTVIVDCGRLRHDSPARAVIDTADLVVIVTRSHVDAVHHVQHAVGSMSPAPVALVCVGRRPYSGAEVAAAIGVTLLGTVPEDPATAAILQSGRGNPRAVAKSPLARAAADIASGLRISLDERAGVPA